MLKEYNELLSRVKKAEKFFNETPTNKISPEVFAKANRLINQEIPRKLIDLTNYLGRALTDDEINNGFPEYEQSEVKI